MTPLFIELCAGTAALSLRLHHPRARPPVSRMGAKTGYADVILRVLGLRPGGQAAHYLWAEPDAGVRLLLEAYRSRELATAAADIIRGWKDEHPRELWERLRDEGPVKGPAVDAREVARAEVLGVWSLRRRLMIDQGAQEADRLPRRWQKASQMLPPYPRPSRMMLESWSHPSSRPGLWPIWTPHT